LDRLREPANAKAWDDFVELYTPFIFYWARRVGMRDDDAADLVQDVFTLLVRKLPDFVYDRNKGFRSWLRTVAINKWNENRRRSGPPVDGDADLSRLPAAESDPFWEAEYRQFILDRALDVLRGEFQPRSWQACWEVVARGRPAAEVAAELGMTVAAVYAAKLRVVNRLRRELDGLID